MDFESEPAEINELGLYDTEPRLRTYVHDAAQPCLIVEDLKLGDSEGSVAL